jgi:hypothetical protein
LAWSELCCRVRVIIETAVARTAKRLQLQLSREEASDLTGDIWLGLVDYGWRKLLEFDRARGLSLPKWLGALASEMMMDALKNELRLGWVQDHIHNTMYGVERPQYFGPGRISLR